MESLFLFLPLLSVTPERRCTAKEEDDLCSTGIAPEYEVLRPGGGYDLFALSGTYSVRCVLTRMIEEHYALLMETWSLMFIGMADQPLIVVLRIKAP